MGLVFVPISFDILRLAAATNGHRHQLVKSRTPRIVTFKNFGRYGRIANTLWQLLAVVSYAKRHGASAIFPRWQDKRDLLHGNEIDDRTPLLKPHLFKLYKEPHSLEFKFHEFPSSPRLALQGYFQNPKYLDVIGEYARHLLQPSIEIQSRMHSRILGWANPLDCAAIHIRRQDYLKFPGWVLDNEYYESAIAVLFKRKKPVEFWIFTDDISWCTSHFANRTDHKFRIVSHPNYRPIEDLFLMAKCSSIIVANSSFSLLAAWMSRIQNSTVVVPRKWLPGYDSSELFYDEWIKL